ncbi:transport protein Avl9-domain-containing protein [Pseudomassariella vexata]|uniref:Transport protein Avl9-domain-containing protein n=1 Tax=Pseudomassariella vexata TaxID=1141098 RepID=A0A1Y2E1R1_9PEZI|nr:transport protein Avl9-domain-containing protein [Pseudomassariella vexata]ORY65488.1 transport protein Avl9-domain-containing protein [Pseudomassariella vexata]
MTTPNLENGGDVVASLASSVAVAAKPIFIPLVTVVDFHHARGPEVEKWFGVPEGTDPAADWDWSLLPFMALSDGAHASTEDFSYFTLLRPAVGDQPATSLFGISCTRQLDASQLLNRPADVTRSTVQKAVVVIADSPQFFGMLRERLSVVTSAWFAQREFTDCEILRRFQDSLKAEKERGQLNEEEDRDQYLGMSLRELVREFKWQTLVLLKCCLLQPKMLFFGARCERLCMMQFSLISLIPGLLRNLQDCAGPELNNYEKKLTRPTSLRTSDRNSLLCYMGLPLQIFGKGSLFGPYTPLQQLDILADFGTKSYIVGSTNSLLLQQKDRYSDILINLDDDTINITSSSLRSALALSASDRRWIDFITQEVNDTWDEKNPGRPNHMGYRGSEEFIRMQFEEYLLSLISSVKYHNYLAQNVNNPKAVLSYVEGDPAMDFGSEWVEYWAKTENYRIWNANTESHLFDIVEPKHPCAGGLTIDDVSRRIQQQVQELHLDERFAVGREVIGRNAATARDKASTMFNKLYADMEAMREAQRKRAEESKAAAAAPPVDLAKAQQTVNSVGAKAGAYIGSWASWAGEKRKQGWGRSSGSTASSTGGGGGGGWGLSRRSKGPSEFGSEKGTPLNSPGFPPEGKAAGFRDSMVGSERSEKERPGIQSSFTESLLDGVSSDAGSSPPASPRKAERPLSAGGITPKRMGQSQLKGIDEVVAEAKVPAQKDKIAPTPEGNTDAAP